MAKPKLKRAKKIKAKGVVEPLKCIWEEHLPKEHRTECPYQDNAKAYANPQFYPQTTFSEAICKFCQGQRKVIALEAIKFNLGEIEMALATGGVSIDIMGLDELKDSIIEAVGKTTPHLNIDNSSGMITQEDVEFISNLRKKYQSIIVGIPSPRKSKSKPKKEPKTRKKKR